MQAMIRTLRFSSLFLLFWILLPAPASGQQLVVDDAEIVDRGACQVEAWHGERASWILPACQFLSNVEISVGAGFIDDGTGHRETEYAVEAKTLIRPLSPGSWGLGVVFGVGPNPSAEGEERHFGDVYAFMPASISLLNDRLVVHGNLGWGWHRETVDHGDHVHESDDHHLTWGLRSDVALSDTFTLLAELYGEDDRRPHYQVGLRLQHEGAGIEVDLTWGGSTHPDEEGPGFTVGLAFVSGRIF